MISHAIHNDLKYLKKTVSPILNDFFRHSLHWKCQLQSFQLPSTDVEYVYKVCCLYPQLLKLAVFGAITSTDNHPNLPVRVNNVTCFSIFDYDGSDIYSLLHSGFYNIRRLVIYSSHKNTPTFPTSVFRLLPRLERIDIDSCYITDFALNLPNPHLLTHFSYTNSEDIPNFVCDPVAVLKQAPNLHYLDLSGCKFDHIALIEELSDRRLSFLNIYHCNQDYEYRQLNADVVGGNMHMDNVLNALFTYEDKLLLLNKTLNQLQHIPFPMKPPIYSRFIKFIIRILRTSGEPQFVRLLVLTISLRLTFQHVSQSCRWLIFSSLLPIARDHLDNQQIISAFCSILLALEPWKYKIPGVIQMVLIVVEAIHRHANSLILFRELSNLLNIAICESSQCFKYHLGQSGCIKLVMDYIVAAIDGTSYDLMAYNMEGWWSFLWNITDETEENVMHIVNNGGLELAIKCCSISRSSDDTVKSIVGTMGNIAEIRAARRVMGLSGMIEHLNRWMNLEFYSFETTYNSCGALCNILSDGQFYAGGAKEVEYILSRIESLVLSWPVQTNRHINYRSLVPIMRLLNQELDERIWLWALWACANLTTYDLMKYVPMLMSVNGLERINYICHHYNPQFPAFHTYANVCNTNCQTYLSRI